jgi:hypothetical protein
LTHFSQYFNECLLKLVFINHSKQSSKQIVTPQSNSSPLTPEYSSKPKIEEADTPATISPAQKFTLHRTPAARIYKKIATKT